MSDHLPARRLDPGFRPGFPYEMVIAAPARWPAKNWRLRRRMAAPFRWAAQQVDRLADLVGTPLTRLAVLIEGQPLVFWRPERGWRRKAVTRKRGKLCWVYEGPVTPALRQMFAEHPQRFADCDFELIRLLLKAGPGEEVR